VIGLVAVNVLQPGKGMNVNLAHIDSSSVQQYVAQTRNQTVTQFLLNIIPQTLRGSAHAASRSSI
jgi:aerobic C4-dicarboxylate transport protein